MRKLNVEIEHTISGGYFFSWVVLRRRNASGDHCYPRLMNRVVKVDMHRERFVDSVLRELEK